MAILRLRNYTPGEDSVALHSSKAKNIIVIAAARSSKTNTLHKEAIKLAQNNRTPFGLLCVSSTFSQVRVTLEEPLCSELIYLGFLRRSDWKKNYHEATLKNGTPIYFRSGESPDTGIRGLNIFAALGDEITLWSEAAYDVMTGRLILTDGCSKVFGTPKGTSNWVYRRFFGPDKRSREDTEFIKFRIKNNPLITDEAIERMRSELDPLMARQEIDGEWVNLSDTKVYYSFDVNRNVRAITPPKPADQVYVGLDYNIGINAWVAGYKDFHRNMTYIIAEGVGDKTTMDVAKTLKSRFGEKVFIVDDASGNSRQQGDAKTQREILQQGGLYAIATNASNPPVSKRHAVVNAHLLNGIGESRLIIDPSCKRLIHELDNLTRKPNSEDVDTQGGKAGHITDALGYLIYKLSGGTAAWSPRVS